ncbi:MAG: LamG domain-containing protein [Flavobacteriales bacterium]|nr:LamG domain-containing protein [Flavobacteriales bacterium]
MKQATTLIAIATFCTLFLQDVHAQVNLSAGLAAHWPFTGDAADSSGNGNHGVVNGAVLTDGADGIPNTAYRFNGASDYITVPNSPSLNPVVYSLSARIKPMGYYSGACQGNVILWKGADTSPGHYGLIYADMPYDANCSNFDTLHQNFYNDHGFNITQADTPYIQTNQWYCILSTFDGDSVSFYVNAVLRYRKNVNALGSNGSGISIGRNSFNNYPYWLNASIDDIRIYDRVLNDQEIDALCGLITTTITESKATVDATVLAPNPIPIGGRLVMRNISLPWDRITLNSQDGRELRQWYANSSTAVDLAVDGIAAGTYLVQVWKGASQVVVKQLLIQ